MSKTVILDRMNKVDSSIFIGNTLIFLVSICKLWDNLDMNTLKNHLLDDLVDYL